MHLLPKQIISYQIVDNQLVNNHIIRYRVFVNMTTAILIDHNHITDYIISVYLLIDDLVNS